MTFAPVTQLGLVAVVGPSGLFVIGLFFFVAGLLTEHSVARRGLRRYVRERLLRLGLPWLVSALLVWPVSVWLAYTAAHRQVSVWWVFSHRDPLLDSGSLWFALVLLLYSVAFALWRHLRRGVRRQPTPAASPAPTLPARSPPSPCPRSWCACGSRRAAARSPTYTCGSGPSASGSSRSAWPRPGAGGTGTSRTGSAAPAPPRR